ncbi:hypothetical protein PORCRE_1610 [Porphyromonas crevioricanis JCM 15906]|uniref:Uncharacterized protein n=1 Tax=Porphyromonas crevioricanis JCM 15906 TaxID=1305617 RepID=T1DSX8_9PORP|nr:hypothetical protein PORCRE_1610 [Porphyromonas crevioricanis JCM 15906]
MSSQISGEIQTLDRLFLFFKFLTSISWLERGEKDLPP